MRTAFAAFALLVAGSMTGPAQADPYKWCAVYGGGGHGGGTNCYFKTLDQCRATVSGMGGFCAPNQFYDGRAAPDSTVSSRPRQPRQPRQWQ